jgi:hypothetical protein
VFNQLECECVLPVLCHSRLRSVTLML